MKNKNSKRFLQSINNFLREFRLLCNRRAFRHCVLTHSSLLKSRPLRGRLLAVAAFGVATIPNSLLSCKKMPTQNQNLNQTKTEITMQESEAVNIPEPEELSKEESQNQNQTKIDLDLTKMSSTMIYSTVFEMLIMAEDYKDKNIRVKGNFNVFVNENTGNRYFAILIPDATACCQQGIEFTWLGDHFYPQDYPQIGQEIEITGRYKVIENQEGITYTYLAVSSLKY